MRSSTAIATSVLAATALAAPPQHGPPGRFNGRPNQQASSSACSAVSTSYSIATAFVTETVTHEATTTAYATVTETHEATISTTTTTTETATPSATAAPSQCLTDEEANGLADAFRMLIQDYSDEFALDALTEDFVDYSSSVNILINGGAQYPKNITAPTFSGRAAFMAGQGSQPKIPFTTLNVFHGCDSVSVRWQTDRSGNGQPSEAAMIPVIGNAIIDAVPAEDSSYGWRIQTLYSEFSSGAWLVNLGVFMPEGPVDYINQANATTKRSIEDFASLRGAII